MSSTSDNTMLDQTKPKEPRNYAAYQLSIVLDAIKTGKTQPISCDPRLIEQQAKSHLSHRAWGFLTGGAGEQATMDANRLAFRQWKLIPRMYRCLGDRDMSIELFGYKYDSPILVAPVGVQNTFHPDKEIGMAEIAAEIGVPYVLSSASASSTEEIARGNELGLKNSQPFAGSRWYQLYWPHDEEITRSLLGRAKKAGYAVLMVTVDTWLTAWRPSDLDNAYLPFAAGIGNAIGFSDPVFRARFKAKHNIEVEEDLQCASLEWLSLVFGSRNHSWEQLAWLKKHWDGPIVLKGIQCVEDAKLAVEAGVDGIVVSNHSGRQLDGAVGSLEMLPEIAEAVGDQITVLFDSGIRTGVDVIKALCLGAKAVLVGRPWVYGLAIGGKKGAKHVLQSILADTDSSMGLAGITSIKDCQPSMLRKIPYGGDKISCE